MQGRIKIAIIVVVILAVLAGIGFYFFSDFFKGVTEEGSESFGKMMYDAIKGPTERIPELNPFERVKLNPFD